MGRPVVYAIDYGTSNSLLSAANEKELFHGVPIDPKAEDPSILKSVLFSSGNDHWEFGISAIEQYLDRPTEGRVFKSLKRFLPDATFKGTNVHGEFLSVSNLIAKQLRYMRTNANEYFEADVDAVVMGCPAVFSQNETSNQVAFDRLRLAAKDAGFKTIEFCPEPIAAAYRFRHQLQQEKIVLVADFGGGTSDFTVLKMGPQRFQTKDVLALGGVSIAGDKFDSAIMKDIISPHFGSKIKYKKPMGSNELGFPKALIRKMSSPADIVMLNRSSVLDYIKDAQRYITDKEESYKLDRLLVLIEDHQGYALFKKIEEAKIRLSSEPKSQLVYSYPTIEIEEEFTKEEFEEASAIHCREILKCLDETLQSASLQHSDIDIVCLTGGTANIPALNAGLKQRFADKLAASARFHSVVDGLGDRAQAMISDS